MSQAYESARTWLGSWFGPAVAPVQVAAPALATTNGSSRLFGAKREKSGYTVTGGRRHKSKKTHRRRR